jgi:diguanylate cyclase (GGDEF)-like protein
MNARSSLRSAKHSIWHQLRNILGLNAHSVTEIMPKRERIRTACLVGLPVVLYYSQFNLQAGLATLARIQMGVALLLLAPALALAVKNGRLPVAETLLMVSSVIIFGCLQISGGVEGTGVYWVYVFPFIAFFITGQKNGWLWSIGFLFMSIAASRMESLAGPTFAYSEAQAAQQHAAFLFYTLTASLFNQLRGNFERRLLDTAQRKAAAANAYLVQLRHSALHDNLTGLPNRVQFFAMLTQKIAQDGDLLKITVAYIKLERILEISNIVGSDESGKLIKSIAQVLRNRMKPDSLLARTGYDEFVLAFSQPKNEDEMLGLHDFLDSRPFLHHTHGQPLHIEYTLGLCSYPDFASGSDQLLRRAEQAMMRARKKHLPLLRYESGQEEAFVRHHLLYGKLMHALESNHLSLVYQPQVDIATDKLVGAEALARWHDPQEGWIAPAEFIPVAEQSGLIHPLTRWIIRQGIAQGCQWHRAGLDITVSLNLSARCFDNPGLLDYLSEALHQSQAEPGWFMLEVTESSFMDSPDKAMRMVGQFREMGFRISIDDFGTGYSSLAYLKDLNADELKIDRGFVMNLPDNANDIAIVQSTIQLAHNLGLKVVAEGIETAAASFRLRELGCNIAQGYYYSKPMSPEDFGKWAADLQGSTRSPVPFHRPLRQA